MSAVQPDLFGDYDAAQERKALWDQPAACPCCGEEEPNGYLLNQNHCYRPGQERAWHSVYGWGCVAMYLVSNHIRYAVLHPDPDGGTKNLDHSAARGRELGLDVDAIVAAARAEAQS